MMIKKILIGFVIFTAIMLIIGFIAGEDTTQSSEDNAQETAPVKTVSPAPSAEPEPAPKAVPTDDGKLTDAQKDEIVKYFKGDAEPNVIDALFPYGTLKLGMHNDGSNRDGFAEYACQILQADFNIKQLVVVRVIDIDELVRTDKWKVIGEANCNY